MEKILYSEPFLLNRSLKLINSLELPKPEQYNGVETAQHVNQSEAGYGDHSNPSADQLQPIIQLLCGLVQSICANPANEGQANTGEAQPLQHRDPLPVIGEITSMCLVVINAYCPSLL